MRISTHNAFESSVQNLQRRQAQLATAQQQLTSGKRVLKASDDPAAAAVAERALAAEARATSQERALDASRIAMQMGESALGEAGDIMQRARELVVSAGNGSYADADRSAIADALQGLRKDLLAVANRSDGSGRYLFGGQGSATPPLRDTAAGVVFDGVSGQLDAASGESSALSLDGRATWLQAPDPANPGAKLSVFDTLDKAAAELRSPGRSGAQVTQTVTTGLAHIDATAANLSSARSRAGEALNRADSIEGRISQNKLDAQRERSGAEDLDMVSAISDFQSRQSGYDAALKTYSLVQRMSLFDYLK